MVRPAEFSDHRLEIGSITKTITGTLLAWMVVSGDVALDDPISTWLDGAGGPITLEQLATHTSGLPRLAPNHFEHDGYRNDDPYAAYSEDLALEGLLAVEVDSDRHTYAYSNFGFQLLGVCLERAAGAPLAALFDEVLFEPLEMAGATADPEANVLQGHGSDGEPTSRWRLLLPGPGGVIAPLAALARYGNAVADPPDGELGAAFRLATEARADRDDRGNQIGLGWHLHPVGLVHHGGGTAGFRSHLVVHRETRTVAASFVNIGGYDLGEQATTLAALGRDPLAIVPEPVDSDEAADWIAVAVETVAAFARGDADGTRRTMSEATAAALSAEQILAVWSGSIEQHGPWGEPTVKHIVRRRGLIEVRLVCRNGDAAFPATVSLDDTRQVVGFVLA